MIVQLQDLARDNTFHNKESLKSKHYAGKWDMTGGGVKAGETPEKAACREVKE